MDPWLISTISVAAGAVIGAIAQYLRERRSREHDKELLYAKTVLESRIDDIHSLIQEEGLAKLLNFFKDQSSPSELLEYLRRVPKLDQHFETMGQEFTELEGELQSLRGLLSDRFFNPVTGRIHDGIESNRTFASRLGERAESKTYLRDHWLSIELVQHVLASEDSIFIESGSTLAYCTLSIMDNIQRFRTSGKPLRVCTNNVAIYMMLLFRDLFEPVLLPGKPNNPYAATFADIEEDGRHRDAVKSFLEENGVNVVFSTASYLDIDYGPHVGSVQNHAMKRILNQYTSAPGHMNIFVIVAEKINRDVKNGKIDKKCKLIFDSDRTENVLENQAVLEKTKKDWEAHLNSSNKYYIVSGSTDTSLCTSKLDELCRQHNLPPFALSDSEGAIFKLPST
jgi:hypothetical protein